MQRYRQKTFPIQILLSQHIIIRKSPNMEIVYVGHRNPRNRALLISNKEWKRLGLILTKKLDEEEAVRASEQLKEMRRKTSKKMVDGWDNTELVSGSKF